MQAPLLPKIYHIAHVDRLPSIIHDGGLWCDAIMVKRNDSTGTTIGISDIKQRRLETLLSSHPDLHVGDCVPFYFCPRSVMLYMIYRANSSDLAYHGGQESIVHLVADFRKVVHFGQTQGKRWAFTSSNAGSKYFDDYADIKQLDQLNWNAIAANQWAGAFKEGKQAEFLFEHFFPWQLFTDIGVRSQTVAIQASQASQESIHRPNIAVQTSWYY